MKKQYPLHTLSAPTHHGNFTPGRQYACLKQTDYGTTKARGFYMDDSGNVRMQPTSLFTPADGVWQPPALPRLLDSAERAELAKRWGVVPITISNWQDPTGDWYQPIRLADALRGSKHSVCTETLTGNDVTEFMAARGFYIQEVAVRWDTQQYGDRIKRWAAEQPALFWDLWRGMIGE